MLTLFHAPQSRFSAILALIEEIGIADRIAVQTVEILRARFGTGAPEPSNPRPEKRVPCLEHSAMR